MGYAPGLAFYLKARRSWARSIRCLPQMSVTSLFSKMHVFLGITMFGETGGIVVPPQKKKKICPLAFAPPKICNLSPPLPFIGPIPQFGAPAPLPNFLTKE